MQCRDALGWTKWPTLAQPSASSPAHRPAGSNHLLVCLQECNVMICKV